jgi:AcrR family transcriptional regulator
MRPSKRDQLVDTALDLFYRHGFNATGIDRVLSEAGVARMTLYNHFKSKEELIVAVLRRRDELFREWLVRRVERTPGTPRDRLLALFDAHGEWFAEERFRGCLFINATAEFSGTNDAICGTAADHKRLVISFIRGLVAAAGARSPEALTDHLALLLEGAIVSAQVLDDPGWAGKARAAAATLIDADRNPGADAATAA